MNSQSPTIRAESVKNNLRIKVLLEKLRNKLKNFSVLDNSGYLLGEVKDVKLDSERQINLVISKVDTYGESVFLLLKSRHIQQVDSVSKSLFVDISKTDIDQLPEYTPSVSKENTATEPDTSLATVVPTVIDRQAANMSDTRPHQMLDDNQASTEEVRFHANDMPTMTESQNNADGFENNDFLDSHHTEVMEEEVIRLLGERLIVDRNRRKVGEVIVRKEVEVRMVEIPIRYEKLIVEQVSPEHKQLAEIQLGEGERDFTGLELMEPISSQKNGIRHSADRHTVEGEFLSPKSASLFLNAVALQRHHGCTKVRVELVLEDEKLEKTYEEWFNRCSGS